MTRSPDAIEASYAACRQAARRARSSFYPSFLLLNGAKRRAMEAVYAFLRHTDDLGDCERSIAERREAIAGWRQVVAAVLSEEGTEGPRKNNLTGESQVDRLLPLSPGVATPGLGGTFRPATDRGLTNRCGACVSHAPASPAPASLAGLALLPALADTLRRFRIPAEHLFAVIEGVEMDLDGRRYRTFAELTQYCDRVASAVGLVCIHVWGFHGEGAFAAARSCGRAFQLTNILRDLKEDSGQGRVYLSLEELDQCGYSPDDLARGVADERFDRLMAVQIDRARGLYHEGAGLFDWLEPSGRRIFGMMVETYYRLLEAIAREPRRVLRGRVRLSGWERLRIAARWTLLPPRRSALP
jgi:phytoene synthase